jgi:hypothetical protein
VGRNKLKKAEDGNRRDGTTEDETAEALNWG